MCPPSGRSLCRLRIPSLGDRTGARTGLGRPQFLQDFVFVISNDSRGFIHGPIHHTAHLLPVYCCGSLLAREQESPGECTGAGKQRGTCKTPRFLGHVNIPLSTCPQPSEGCSYQPISSLRPTTTQSAVTTDSTILHERRFAKIFPVRRNSASVYTIFKLIRQVYKCSKREPILKYAEMTGFLSRPTWGNGRMRPTMPLGEAHIRML